MQEITDNHFEYFTWAVSQKNPGRFLKEYIEWVNTNYTVDKDNRNSTRRTSAPIPMATNTRPGWSVLHGYANEDRRKPTCDPADISRRGSNAYVDVSTCKVCGTRTKTKKSATKDPSSCKHERTTSTGSSSKTCRLWCLDCQIYVAEEKREERKKTNPGMQPSKDTTAFDNRPNPTLNSSQMLLIASTFKAMVRTHAAKMAPTDTMTHRELEKFLEDSVDISLPSNISTTTPSQSAGPSASSWRTAVSSSSHRNQCFLAAGAIVEPITKVAVPAPHTGNTAMTHATSSTDHGSSTRMSSARAPLYPVHQAPKSVGVNWKRNQPGLPTVDLRKTDKLFATLDEGCNSTCHTVGFAERAREVLQRYGRIFGELEGEGTSYKGLGMIKSKGKRAIPWGIELLKKSTLIMTPGSCHKGFIQGTILSHEIENPSNDLYMLLSLHAQASLGFVKDVAAGTVYLKHQDAYVQLYAVEGCDLRAVCISDFPDVMTKVPQTPLDTI